MRKTWRVALYIEASGLRKSEVFAAVKALIPSLAETIEYSQYNSVEGADITKFGTVYWRDTRMDSTGFKPKRDVLDLTSKKVKS